MVTGCHEPTGSDPSPEVGYRVEVAGCRGVVREPGRGQGIGRCEIRPDRLLTLWIAAADPLADGGRSVVEEPSVRGAEIVEHHRLGGGLRLVLEVEPGVEELVLGADSPSPWRLSVAKGEKSPWEQEIRQLGRAGQLELARERLRAVLDGDDGGEAGGRGAGPAAAADRGIAQGLLALVEMGLGNDEEAEVALRRAIEEHRASGRAFDEVNDATRLVFSYLDQRRFSEARQLLDDLPPEGRDTAEMAYYRAYYRGVLAEAVGDARNALVFLRRAVAVAERLALGREQFLAEQVLGRLLQQLGRGAEAADLYARLRQVPPVDLGPCDRAQLLNNHAWSLLLAREAGATTGVMAAVTDSGTAEAGGVASTHPLELLAAAGEVLEDPGAAPCAAAERVNVELNRALAHLHAGRGGEARAALDAARRLGPAPAPALVLWQLELEGRIALAKGDPLAAEEHYRHLGTLATNSVSPEAAWRAATGRARALVAQGRDEAALVAYAEAEALLDREVLAVPLHEGRDTFAAAREMATRRHLELLLDGGRESEALALARRSRARFLRSLRRGDRLAQLGSEEQERWDEAVALYRAERETLDREAADDWQLSAVQLDGVRVQRARRLEELRRLIDRGFALSLGPAEAALPPLPAGHLTLIYHPVVEGWIGFAASPEQVVVRRLGRLEEALAGSAREAPARDAGRLAQRLLTPFEQEIEAAEALRFLPYGPLRALDFHALPYAGEVLLAYRPVVYGLDLGAPSLATARGADGGGPAMLVVGDPQGNLPAAAAEARRVAAVLEGDYEVLLLTGDQALGTNLRRSLAESELFHYAGHGRFAGSGGWQSALPLAQGGRLTLGDILTLGHAPGSVVLSGCETARSTEASPLESIGLAQAFLVAGSHQVVATTRPVPDDGAALLVDALYGEVSGGASRLELAQALRAAQLHWRSSEPGADWASFRLLEP